MTADRDALIELIRDNYYGNSMSDPDLIADAIIAAGWQAPEPPHRHQWAVGGFGTWSCACGALKYGKVGDADDYKQARGAAKLDRPAEEIIREGRGE